MNEMDPPEIQQETNGSSHKETVLGTTMLQPQRSSNTKLTNIIDYNPQEIDTPEVKNGFKQNALQPKPMELEVGKEDEKG